MKKCVFTISQRSIRWLSILVALLFCSACGTFQLAKKVDPPVGKTKDQQQLDNLTCKDRAKLEANTAARQTGAFLLGMTIVGAPVAHEIEKSKQREVYVQCMRALGYTVIPIEEETPSRESVPASTGSLAKDEITPKMENLKIMRDRGLITEEEYTAKKKELLDKM